MDESIMADSIWVAIWTPGDRRRYLCKYAVCLMGAASYRKAGSLE